MTLPKQNRSASTILQMDKYNQLFDAQLEDMKQLETMEKQVSNSYWREHRSGKKKIIAEFKKAISDRAKILQSMDFEIYHLGSIKVGDVINQ